MTSPALIVHADWSVDRRKRWMASAVLRPDASYVARPPQRVGDLGGFWTGLETDAPAGTILVGFDFPVGLPRAYADRARISSFLEALDQFGDDFYRVARTPEEISLDRPFYPDRPGGRCHQQLLTALGLENWDRLHRRCDRATRSRPAACPIFWTLGGNQVGKAALTGWRHLLAPARRDGVDVAIWPFDGPLSELLGRHRFVVTETYPGEVYGHLGLKLRAHGGKRRQAARSASAASLLRWTKRADVALAAELRTDIEDGFGPDANADDRFDAVIGLFGMLNVVRGDRPAGDPDHPAVQRIEGWILGLDPAELTTAGERSNRPRGGGDSAASVVL